MRGNHLLPLPILKIFAMFPIFCDFFLLIRLNNMTVWFVSVKMCLKRILHGK